MAKYNKDDTFFDKNQRLHRIEDVNENNGVTNYKLVEVDNGKIKEGISEDELLSEYEEYGM